jgi:type VI secretion system protein ImpA
MPMGLPLDFDALLAPIGGTEPAGSSSTYLELRSQLDDLRKEVNPDDFDADDPMRPDQPKFADWSKIEELTRKALERDAKDLRLAGYLVEALVHQYHFDGLAEGLRLLREMLERCWDRCYPAVENGDVEVRVGVFNSLDDLQAKGRTPFPNYLRMLPIVVGGKLKHSYEDWKKSQDKGGTELAESFAKALKESKPEQAAKTAQAIEYCLREHGMLLKAIEQRFGPVIGPSLANLRRALEDCGRVARVVTEHHAGPGPEKNEEERPGEGEKADNQSNRAAAGASRAAAYRQLAEAAAMLERLEPHSPIPYLVKRAVELGSLPFPQLMKALIRDANVLAELTREFGLKAEGEEKK